MCIFIGSLSSIFEPHLYTLYSYCSTILLTTTIVLYILGTSETSERKEKVVPTTELIPTSRPVTDT